MPTAKEEFENISRRLDVEIEQIPAYGQWMVHLGHYEYVEEPNHSPYWKYVESDTPYKDPLNFTNNFIDEIRNILFILGIRNFYQDRLHEYLQYVKFNPKQSSYFRPGNLLRYDSAKLTVNNNLRAAFGIGFDEGRDYEDDEKPDLVIWYTGNSKDGREDATNYDPSPIDSWKNVLNEFFDMETFYRRAPYIQWPLERNVQKIIFEIYS